MIHHYSHFHLCTFNSIALLPTAIIIYKSPTLLFSLPCFCSHKAVSREITHYKARIQFKFVTANLSEDWELFRSAQLHIYISLVKLLSLPSECCACLLSLNPIFYTRFPYSQWWIHGEWQTLSSTVESTKHIHTLDISPHCYVWRVPVPVANQIIHSGSKFHCFLFSHGFLSCYYPWFHLHHHFFHVYGIFANQCTIVLWNLPYPKNK